MFCEFIACNGDCLAATSTGNSIPSACSVDGKCLKVENKDVHCDFFDAHGLMHACGGCTDKETCVIANIK